MRGQGEAGHVRSENDLLNPRSVVEILAGLAGLIQNPVRFLAGLECSVVVGIGGVFGREGAELFILNNEIVDNGWDGIALYRGATAVIADNIIKKGRGAGIGITWDATALVFRNRISEYWKGIGTFGESRACLRPHAGVGDPGLLRLLRRGVYLPAHRVFARW